MWECNIFHKTFRIIVLIALVGVPANEFTKFTHVGEDANAGNIACDLALTNLYPIC